MQWFESIFTWFLFQIGRTFQSLCDQKKYWQRVCEAVICASQASVRKNTKPNILKYMRSIKPGRGPSALGAMGGIVAVLFGIFWTVMAFSMTRGAPEPIGIIFPLFGVLFVIAGIINVGYNIYNAAGNKRLSVFDITSTKEEADPLNEIFGASQSGIEGKESVESKLRELDRLRGGGIISETEYAAQRQRILNSI